MFRGEEKVNTSMVLHLGTSCCPGAGGWIATVVRLVTPKELAGPIRGKHCQKTRAVAPDRYSIVGLVHTWSVLLRWCCGIPLQKTCRVFD